MDAFVKPALSTLTPRDYQQRILDRALLSNTIVYLPTGTGKTLIATYLLSFRIQDMLRRSSHNKDEELSEEPGSPYGVQNIKDMNNRVCKQSAEDRAKHMKLVVFVAPTRVLLRQQLEYFKKNSFVEGLQIEEFSGSTTQEGKSMSRWEHTEWEKHLSTCHLAGMTPAILCMLLEHNILPVSRIDSIIFDECHHILGKNDPMGKIVDALNRLKQKAAPNSSIPHILGMTASLLSRKKGRYCMNCITIYHTIDTW